MEDMKMITVPLEEYNALRDIKERSQSALLTLQYGQYKSDPSDFVRLAIRLLRGEVEE